MSETPQTTDLDYFAAVEGALDALTRRLDPSLRPQAKPLPVSITKAPAQAANAQALYEASKAANSAGATNAPVPGTIQDPALQNSMLFNQAPQARPVTMFAPGAPLIPATAIEPPDGARQYEYQINYNAAGLPRSTESSTFQQLRAMAILTDAVQVAEQVYFDIFARLTAKVCFEDGIIPDGQKESDPQWQKIIAPAQEFVDAPDGVHPTCDWIAASFRDVAELGQSPVFLVHNRIGQIIGLRLIDGTTVKPLIEEHGWQPRAPYPAYQQWLYGVPGGRYTSEQIYMMRETMRTDSPYPYSRIERILMPLNLLLRRENLNLTRYTDGAIPEGILFPSASDGSEWDARKLADFEKLFNDLLSGNDKRRVRLKVGPPGGSYSSTRPDDPQIALDRFIWTIVAAAFGLTLDEMAMTETSNRSVGQSQENVIYRRAVMPVTNRYARFFTWVIKQRFDKRLKVKFTGIEEPEDLKTRADTLSIGVKVGAISPASMARMMGWTPEVETPPFVVSTSAPFFLDSLMALKDQQLQAQSAGLQLAIQNPGGLPPPGTPGAPGQVPEESEEDGKKPPAKGNAPPAKGAPDEKSATQQKPGTRGGDTPPPGKGSAPAKAPPKQEQQPEPPAKPKQRAAAPEEVREEYRRWYEVALKAAKQGRMLPHFTSAVIPLEDYAYLASDLARAKTPDAVRLAFARAKTREQTPARPKPVGTVTTLEAQHSMGVASTKRHLSHDMRRIFEEALQAGHHQLVQ